MTPRHIRQLEKRHTDGSYRRLKLSDNKIDFSSNDYLGFARDAELATRVHEAAKSLHLGSTGSRLLSGNSQLAMQTETYLAHAVGAERTLILNSGYVANLAVLSSIPQRGDTIIYDELCHASIKDGMRLSLARRFSFAHNNLTELEALLQKAEGDSYVITESVFSMDGDEAPIREIIRLCKKYHARLILDEAHATGLYGHKGGGISQQLDIAQDIFCRVYTFGKAMGIHGAAIAGSELLIEYLINFARAFIYTTALPNHGYIAIKEAFEYLKEMQSRPKQVKKLVYEYLQEYNAQLASRYERTDSHHPIQTLIVPGVSNVTHAASKLSDAGIDVRPILSPTVKSGTERLRICLHTFNTKEEVSLLVGTLAAL